MSSTVVTAASILRRSAAIVVQAAVALVVVFLFTPALLVAQRADTTRTRVAHAADTSGGTVRIALPGEVRLHAWAEPRVEVRAEQIETGRVFGYTTGAAHRDYRVHIAEEAGDLVITSSANTEAKTVGISTRRESLTHDVYVPTSSRICLRVERGTLRVDGAFRELDVASNARVTDARLRDADSASHLNRPCTAAFLRDPAAR